MENNQNDYEVMRTYARAWQTEVVLYHLFGRPLWFPLSLKKAVFFMLGLIIMFFLIKVFPAISLIPFVGDPIVIYIVFPFLIMRFFTSIALDGKPPHIYFVDQIKYMLEDKKFNMYIPIEEKRVSYTSKIGYRIPNMLSMIDLKLCKKGGK